MKSERGEEKLCLISDAAERKRICHSWCHSVFTGHLCLDEWMDWGEGGRGSNLGGSGWSNQCGVLWRQSSGNGH